MASSSSTLMAKTVTWSRICACIFTSDGTSSTQGGHHVAQKFRTTTFPRKLLSDTRELILVDDGSTDRTREIAAGFPEVRVIEAGVRGEGWGGKSNALWTAAQQARGAWLLFTDADTVHAEGSLTNALLEAKQQRAALVSYSPE